MQIVQILPDLSQTCIEIAKTPNNRYTQYPMTNLSFKQYGRMFACVRVCMCVFFCSFIELCFAVIMSCICKLNCDVCCSVISVILLLLIFMTYLEYFLCSLIFPYVFSCLPPLVGFCVIYLFWLNL